jgi:hypothetical protein
MGDRNKSAACWNSGKAESGNDQIRKEITVGLNVEVISETLMFC